jgi:hypothetical protein
VIVDSFYNETPQFTDSAAEFLRSKGIKVDVFNTSEVTVDFYRQLPSMGYKLIILRVHSGILNETTKPTYLFTNEPYSEDPLVTSKYFTELMSGALQKGVIDPDNPVNPVFTAGPLFVSGFTQGYFNNSIVVLSSCYGLYSNQLADAFVGRGASVFISWDERVGLAHTDEAVSVFLRSLAGDNMTVAKSVEKVMTEVGPDRMYSSYFRYYPETGIAGNMTLRS